MGASEAERRGSGWRLYAVTAVAFILFGGVALASIGMPFVFIGLGMLLALPLRRRPSAFIATLAAVAAFVIVAMLVAPLGCTETATFKRSLNGITTCDNLIGIDYKGADGYNAPLWPAVAAGVGGGLLAGVVAFTLTGKIRRSRAT